MIDKPERGLGGYNKRSDYGEIDKSTKIQKDNKVYFSTDKDKIFLAIIKCEIVKLIGRRKEKRTWENEILYKQDEEKTITFLGKLSKIAKLKDSETIEVKGIIKIKPIGLVT